MTFYMGITKSMLYFEALAAYDQKHCKAYNAEIKAEIDKHSKILAALRITRKEKINWFNSQIKQFDALSKQFLQKFHETEEYSSILNEYKKAKKENEFSNITKTLAKKMKSLDTTFKNTNNEYLSAKNEILKLRSKKVAYLTNDVEIDKYQDKIQDLQNKMQPQMLVVMKKASDDSNLQKDKNSQVNFVPTGEYSKNNVCEVIGPGSGGSKIMVELHKPACTCFLKNCRIEEDEYNNLYKIIACFKDTSNEMCVGAFMANNVVDVPHC